MQRTHGEAHDRVQTVRLDVYTNRSQESDVSANVVRVCYVRKVLTRVRCGSIGWRGRLCDLVMKSRPAR
jgi:hypothetical protein